MVQLHVDRAYSDDPGNVAETFAKHFYTIYSHILPPPSPISVSYSDFLPSVSISEYNIQNAVKRLRPKKSLGLDDIPSIIIKAHSTILMPILQNIFNLSVISEVFS
jgi:hypothetical protein